jgi:hypothetical protein
MHGWQARTFPELKVVHFGLVGGGAGGAMRARFKGGRVNADLGFHPLFLLARTVYTVKERPYLLGSLADLVGFAVARRRTAVRLSTVRLFASCVESSSPSSDDWCSRVARVTQGSEPSEGRSAAQVICYPTFGVVA